MEEVVPGRGRVVVDRRIDAAAVAAEQWGDTDDAGAIFDRDADSKHRHRAGGLYQAEPTTRRPAAFVDGCRLPHQDTCSWCCVSILDIDGEVMSNGSIEPREPLYDDVHRVLRNVGLLQRCVRGADRRVLGEIGPRRVRVHGSWWATKLGRRGVNVCTGWWNGRHEGSDERCDDRPCQANASRRARHRPTEPGIVAA